MGFITKATPRTDEEWEEFNAIWEDICNAHGCEALALDKSSLMEAWSEVN
jgi:hypothetical protein